MSKWYDSVKELLNKRSSGRFASVDKTGAPVTLSWRSATIRSPEYRTLMEQIAETAVSGFTSVEMEFLRVHPEAVTKEANLAGFRPFFEQKPENVDWAAVENQMRSTIAGYFLTDVSTLPPDIRAALEHVLYLVVTVDDQKTGVQLGSCVFMISSTEAFPLRTPYATGDVKVMSIALVPEAQNRGLGKLLMSSIFKIIPDTKRLFLATRITNTAAQRAYAAWGFMPDSQIHNESSWFIPEHWINLEYRADQTTILQKSALQLKSKEWV